MKIQRIKNARNEGFTLIELLVVIAIIAVVGGGVAVTYQKLDDQAKTAMEISDLSVLKKIVKHWGAINDYAIPDELDSLVDDEGNLYTPVQSDPSGFATVPASSSEKGLNGPIGYATAEVAEAPDVVLSNLAAAGMDFTYTHLVSRENANDSTFEPGTFGQDVDTSNTLTTLVAGDSEARAQAELVVAADDSAHDYGTPGNEVPFTVGSQSFDTPAEFATGQSEAQDILDANTTDRLAFVFPGGGQQIAAGPTSGPGFSNLTDEIITNAGLSADLVADPNVPVASLTTEKYYLVVMGFGRFASIYQGKAIRSDAPAVGKRLEQSDTDYSRYLAVIRVPVDSFGGPTSTVDPPVVVDVLSPQGYSAAALRDNFIRDKKKIQDDNT